MNIPIAAVLIGLAATSLPASAAETPLARPKSGKVEIMPLGEIKQGMKGTAWTVFQGTEPEPIPVEIIGISKNMWGPKQDIILGKRGGKAAGPTVAKGMSGGPGRHHAERADAGDRRQRQIPSGRGAHARQGGGAERAGRRLRGGSGIADPDRFAPGVFGHQLSYR